MPPEDQVRIQHLIDAASTALRFVEHRSRSDLDDDEMLMLALTKLVEIVGEAAKQVTEEGRAEHPDVPWSAAARMRDRLVRTTRARRRKSSSAAWPRETVIKFPS